MLGQSDFDPLQRTGAVTSSVVAPTHPLVEVQREVGISYEVHYSTVCTAVTAACSLAGRCSIAEASHERYGHAWGASLLL